MFDNVAHPSGPQPWRPLPQMKSLHRKAEHDANNNHREILNSGEPAADGGHNDQHVLPDCRQHRSVQGFGDRDVATEFGLTPADQQPCAERCDDAGSQPTLLVHKFHHGQDDNDTHDGHPSKPRGKFGMEEVGSHLSSEPCNSSKRDQVPANRHCVKKLGDEEEREEAVASARTTECKQHEQVAQPTRHRTCDSQACGFMQFFGGRFVFG